MRRDSVELLDLAAQQAIRAFVERPAFVEELGSAELLAQPAPVELKGHVARAVLAFAGRRASADRPGRPGLVEL